MIFDAVLSSILKSFSSSPEVYLQKRAELSMPLISAETMQKICMTVSNIFQNDQALLEISSPVIIVGDLHGQIFDLIRILKENGSPDNKKYLFLGDLVDRGEFSIETVTTIFLLKIVYPSNVFIIRGNHEFEAMCSKSGFAQQIEELYDNFSIFHYFLEAFSFMPLSALIDSKSLCIHGGLGPQLYSLKQLREIKRPIADFGNPICDAILWSDPSDIINYFEYSTRGTGYLFGEQATSEFCDSNKINLIIRAHECVGDGVEISHGGRCITVFSASNYCGIVGNKGAVLIFETADKFEVITYPPLPWVKRCLVKYKGKPVKTMKPKTLKKVKMSESLIMLPRYKVIESVKVPNIVPQSPRNVKFSKRLAKV